MTTSPAVLRPRAVRRLALALVLASLGAVGIVEQVGASGPCGEGAVAWEQGGSVRCIHVDDRDDLIETERSLHALQGDAATVAAASPWARAVADDEVRLVCDRSSDPHRVKVLYAYTGSSDLGGKRAVIERTVAQAQSQYDRSSEVHGAADAWIPRFVTEAKGAAGCRLAITPVKVSSSSVTSGNPAAMFDELERKGFRNRNLSYLVMVDTGSTTYCGLGSSYYDDRSNPSVNANNTRPAAAFSRADRWCWDIAVAHELAHNLGAVQPSAPHATDFFHCTDGLDAMCYADGSPQSGAVRDDVCTGGDAAFVLDCRADDYFSPSPRWGTYLYSHWNIADSDWLLRTNLRSWDRGGTVGASGTQFDDVAYDSTFAEDVTALAASGITKGCNSASTRFCPTAPVLRQEMAAFLDRALPLRSGSKDFVDVATSSPYRSSIQALAREGITSGCNPPANSRFCPTAPVTRAQMAVFLTEALDLPAGSTRFADVPSSSPYRGAIQALARADITRGCNPPRNDRFCPNEVVTRQQMAAFLVRADLTD